MGVFDAVLALREPRGGAEAFGAIDVGASKIVCLVARRADNASADVALAGVGVQPTRWGPDGAPADFATAARAVGVAVRQALAMAGDPSCAFVAAYGAPGLQTTVAIGQNRIGRGGVTAADAAHAVSQASDDPALADQRVLHATPLAYSVDSAAAVADPRGLQGRVLAAQVALVHAPEAALSALEALFEAAHIDVAAIVAGPLAAGLGVLTPEERERGAIVIDIGAGATGLGVFAGGAVLHAETRAGGGTSVTNALAQHLGATFAAAERAKILHGGLGVGADPREIVEIPTIGPDGRLEPASYMRGGVQAACAPPLVALLDEAGRALERCGHGPGAEAWEAVICGGAAATPGLREIARERLGRPIRMGSSQGFEENPTVKSFAVAAGLLRYAAETGLAPKRPRGAGAVVSVHDAAARLAHAVEWFKRNF